MSFADLHINPSINPITNSWIPDTDERRDGRLAVRNNSRMEGVDVHLEAILLTM